MNTLVRAHDTDGQKNSCEDGSNGTFLRNLNENNNIQYKIPSEKEPQKRIGATIDNDDNSLDKRFAQSSATLNFVEPPSPSVNVELRKKVEELKRLVANEQKKFQVVIERLAEQQVVADMNAQHIKDDWEAKIRELQKEKYALSICLQSAETAHLASLLAGRESQSQNIETSMQPSLSMMPPTSGSVSQHRISSHRLHKGFLKELEADQVRQKSGTVKIPQITEQEAKKLKQEILQQEVLIRGYQQENEKAMQKIKEVRSEAKEKARLTAEENAQLASQLLLQCQSRGQASGPEAATELSLQEALDREAQLKKLEVQLKQEIARLNEELLKAHAELEQMEKTVSKTLDDLECELASLKSSLTEERENHARTSITKEEVTKSLEENQRLLNAIQITTEQQAAQIVELSSKVATYEGDHGTNLNEQSLAAEDRHISLHQKRNLLVDERRRVRKPELGSRVVKPGISALAQVSRDESEKVRKLQMELAILRKQSNTKEDESNRRLSVLKVELERSKQEYEKRLQASHSHADPTAAAELQVAPNQVKTSQTQVANIHIYYSRKLKELKDKLAESKNEQTKFKLVVKNETLQRKIPPTQTVKDARLQGRIVCGANNVKELIDAKEQVGMLEDVLNKKDHTIKILQHKLGHIQIDGKGDDPSAAISITAKQTASLAKLKNKIQSCSPQRVRPTQ